MRRGLYEVLGVSADATHDEIKLAYRSLAKLYHPDLGGAGQADAVPRFVELQDAYQALSDPLVRQEYDEQSAVTLAARLLSAPETPVHPAHFQKASIGKRIYSGALCALLAAALISIGYSPRDTDGSRPVSMESQVSIRDTLPNPMLGSLTTETTKALKSDVAFEWPNKNDTQPEPELMIAAVLQPRKDPIPDPDIRTTDSVSRQARDIRNPIGPNIAMREITSPIAEPPTHEGIGLGTALAKVPLPIAKPKPTKKFAAAVPELDEVKPKKRGAIVEPKASSLTGRRGENAGWQNYVAHVVSSTSRLEARATLKRIRANQARLVHGLTTRITKSNVDGSMVYTAGFGPLPTHKAAADLCRMLLAAGETDCVVWPPWSLSN